MSLVDLRETYLYSTPFLQRAAVPNFMKTCRTS